MITEGMKCSKCGGMNVSLDFDTNAITCHDCKKTDKAKRFDLEEYKLNSIAQEETDIARLKIKGTDVNITTKIKDVQDLNKDIGVDNDFSQMGLS